jgi:hypothetical protein
MITQNRESVNPCPYPTLSSVRALTPLERDALITELQARYRATRHNPLITDDYTRSQQAVPIGATIADVRRYCNMIRWEEYYATHPIVEDE